MTKRRLLSIVLILSMMLSVLGVPTASAHAAGKTPLERLSNCAVTIMQDGETRTAAFQQEKTTLDYAVQLDDEIPSATLTIYAYPGTVSFDPDTSAAKRLTGKSVVDGEAGTIEVDLSAIPVGYKVVANLYVNLDGDDFYRNVPSQSLEVVDENGQGFTDYTYPDVAIDETELVEGTTSLHLTLTGDERIFDAAKEGKTSIAVAVAQYPDGESFDFEGSNQISLASNFSVTEPFANKEFTLSEPLRAGYRVRAVVYWSQNVDIYLPKGNDYEEMFHRPDDSVLITKAAEPLTVALPEVVKVTDAAVQVSFTGEVPEGSMLLLKSYGPDDAIERTKGIVAGTAFNVSGDTSVTLNTPAMIAGNQLVAFLLQDGNQIGQSEAVTITADADFTISYEGLLTTDTTEADVTITPSEAMKDVNLYIVGLCKVDENGRTDIVSADSYVARAFGQKPGVVSLSGISGLNAGDKVRFVIRYDNNGIQTLESDNYVVSAPLAEDSITIQETSFAKGEGQATATVVVSGCDFYKGDYLRLTMGRESTNDNADNRTTLTAGQRYNGTGTYTFSFDASKLVGGETVQAYLYHYDGDTDRTYYLYSNAVAIEKEAVEAKVAIETSELTEDSTSVWVSGQFDDSALLALYASDAEDFNAEDLSSDERSEYVGIKYWSSAPSNSQKIDLSGSLTAGQKLYAVLWQNGISGELLAQSQPVVVQAAPEMSEPIAVLKDTKVTAGMTTLNAALNFDSRLNQATYTLYQFTGDTLNRDEAEVLTSGSLYRSTTNQTLYVNGKLKADHKLQLVLTAGKAEALSAVLTVQPSPDWGTPYVAFDTNVVKSDATSIPVVIDYSDEYLTMEDDFYCDVTIYSIPAQYSDEEIEERELWENFSIAKSVAKINSRLGDATRGNLEITVREGAELTPGDRLFIKLRLPHTEWVDEEVDYISKSVGIVAAEDAVQPPMVLLYNLDENTSMGQRLRTVLESLGVEVVDVTDDQLGEQVGYLVKREGFTAAEEPYIGDGRDVEFMLMANMSEAMLDRFLAAMQENGIFIPHKAVTTDTNIYYQFHELIDDIEDEHETFQLLLELDKLIDAAEALNEDSYGDREEWPAFIEALDAANATLSSYEPTTEELIAAIDNLKTPYLVLSGLQELTGTVAIDLQSNDDGTYTLTASLPDGELSDLIYSWSDGTVGNVLANIAPENLIAQKVSVTSPSAYGNLTAQLQVPSAPKLAVKSASNALTVTVEEGTDGINQPAATAYQVQLYKAGALVSEQTGAGPEFAFEDLEAATDYEVQAVAISPVGTSDQVTSKATTARKSSSGGGGGVININPSKPDIDDNNPNESDVDDNQPEQKQPFDDVSISDYFNDAVNWAVEQDITKGTSATTFSPNGVTTRAEAVTFLWRQAGSPAPASNAMSFVDVAEDAYYHDAVLWAVSAGITVGTSDTTFSPDMKCSRAHIVTFLYRQAGQPAVDATNPFFDVSADDYFINAVLWAVDNDITVGTSATTFSPNADCSRAQIVSFLYRQAGDELTAA